jgi:hypothetical protein
VWKEKVIRFISKMINNPKTQEHGCIDYRQKIYQNPHLLEIISEQ